MALHPDAHAPNDSVQSHSFNESSRHDVLHTIEILSARQVLAFLHPGVQRHHNPPPFSSPHYSYHPRRATNWATTHCSALGKPHLQLAFLLCVPEPPRVSPSLPAQPWEMMDPRTKASHLP